MHSSSVDDTNEVDGNKVSFHDKIGRSIKDRMYYHSTSGNCTLFYTIELMPSTCDSTVTFRRLIAIGHPHGSKRGKTKYAIEWSLARMDQHYDSKNGETTAKFPKELVLKF